MFEYDKLHGIRDISIESLEPYLLTVIEASVQESKRLYDIVDAQLKDPSFPIDPTAGQQTQVSHGFPDNKDYFFTFWVETSRGTKDIWPSAVRKRSTRFSGTDQEVISWYRTHPEMVSWFGQPNFEITLRAKLFYPVVYFNLPDPSFKIHLTENSFSLHNEACPALLTIKEGKIVDASFFLHGARVSFWDIYEGASSSNKKLLLRDWLHVRKEIN